MQLPQPRVVARARRAAARCRRALRDRARSGAGRQPQVQGHEEVSGTPRNRPRGNRRDRRPGGAAGQRQGRAAGARRVRVQFHGRLDGIGRRRAFRARRARRLREPPAVRVRVRLGWRADAGGRQLAVPDGEDHRGSAGAHEGPAAVRIDPHRSDDGRRLGVVRVRRRSRARGTRRADRLRGPARHRADGARKAARGLPARRVPRREGRARHDRRPAQPARRARAPAGVADAAAGPTG